MCIHFKKWKTKSATFLIQEKWGRLIIEVRGESFAEFWWTKCGTTALATSSRKQNISALVIVLSISEISV